MSREILLPDGVLCQGFDTILGNIPSDVLGVPDLNHLGTPVSPVQGLPEVKTLVIISKPMGSDSVNVEHTTTMQFCPDKAPDSASIPKNLFNSSES